MLIFNIFGLVIGFFVIFCIIVLLILSVVLVKIVIIIWGNLKFNKINLLMVLFCLIKVLKNFFIGMLYLFEVIF